MKKIKTIYITTAIAILSVALAVGIYLHYESRIAELTSMVDTLKREADHLRSDLSRYRMITLVDDHGYVVNLTSYPKRIVSLAPSNTEILFAVGAGDMVVGVTDYDDYPYNFSAWIKAGNMTSVGGYWNPSLERIVALKPDLILASPASVEVADRLRRMGYNVLILDPKSIEGVLKDIILVGRATGRDVEAGILVRSMRERIDSIVNRLSNVSYRPKVYFEVWSNPLMSAGPGTWINELIKLAGGRNIFEDAGSQWPIVSSEAIIQRNPDIIIFPSSHGIPRFWGSFEEVKKRPGWSSINAIKNGRLYVIDSDIISRPGPRLVDALETLAKIIHPEIFKSQGGS